MYGQRLLSEGHTIGTHAAIQVAYYQSVQRDFSKIIFNVRKTRQLFVLRLEKSIEINNNCRVPPELKNGHFFQECLWN